MSNRNIQIPFRVSEKENNNIDILLGKMRKTHGQKYNRTQMLIDLIAVVLNQLNKQYIYSINSKRKKKKKENKQRKTKNKEKLKGQPITAINCQQPLHKLQQFNNWHQYYIYPYIPESKKQLANL